MAKIFNYSACYPICQLSDRLFSLSTECWPYDNCFNVFYTTFNYMKCKIKTVENNLYRYVLIECADSCTIEWLYE